MAVCSFNLSESIILGNRFLEHFRKYKQIPTKHQENQEEMFNFADLSFQEML